MAGVGLVKAKRISHGEIVMVRRDDYAVTICQEGREVWLENIMTDGWRMAWKAKMRDVSIVPHCEDGGIYQRDGWWIN